jgi:hypothetical protein
LAFDLATGGRLVDRLRNFLKKTLQDSPQLGGDGFGGERLPGGDVVGFLEKQLVEVFALVLFPEPEPVALGDDLGPSLANRCPIGAGLCPIAARGIEGWRGGAILAVQPKLGGKEDGIVAS